MEQRLLGRTGREVSIIGLGCWQLGSDWGATQMSESEALAVLNGAIDAGVTFLDTADVYGDGVSEQRIGRLLAERGSAGVHRPRVHRRKPERGPVDERERRLSHYGREHRVVDVDRVVVVHPGGPAALPPSWLPSEVSYRMIGDAFAPRGLLQASYEGTVAAACVGVDHDEIPAVLISEM